MLSRFTFRAACGAVLMVFGLSACAAVVATWHDRSVAIANGIREARNTAIMLGGQIERSIHVIDLAIRDAQELVDEANPWRDVDDAALPDLMALRTPLKQLRDRIPFAHQVMIADRHGRVVVSTAAAPTRTIDIADRDYFKELASADGDHLAISLPVANRATGDPVVILARRIRSPGGGFRGIVLISVEKSYFAQLYGAIAPIEHQTFTLLRRDGTILIRFPDQENAPGMVVPASSPFFTVVAEGGGSFRSIGLFGATDVRWIGVAPLKDYPVVANITIPQDVMLRDWQRRAMATAVVVLAALAVMLFLLCILARQFRKVSASEARLAEEALALEREHAELVKSEAELRRNEVRLVDSEAALRRQIEIFDAAMNNMTQGLAMFDGDARLVVCNRNYCELLGLPPESTVPGMSLREILAIRNAANGFPVDIDATIDEIVADARAGRPAVRERTVAHDRILLARQNPLAGGGWVVSFTDITARRRSEARLHYLAHNDLLTGLANRSSFLEHIAALRDRLAANGQRFSVFVLDLDRFKRVNDLYGHDAGDRLLKEAAARLQRAVRAGDLVARLGGDEFAILQTPPRCDDSPEAVRDGAVALANRIIALIAEPFRIHNEKIFIGTSIGIAVAPDHGREPDDLMKRADLALYRAKSEGRNGYSFFDDRLAAEDEARCRLSADLRTALARSEFEVHYQPFVAVAGGRLCGLEALVRWRHPEQGLITPDQFLVLAEDVGMVGSLGDWILHSACTAALAWPADVKLAVNLSPSQFHKPDLFDTIVCTLVDTGLSPDRLEIEISERILLEGDADWMSVLHQLRNLGVAIVLDDFGMGQSSLGFLKLFPFDKVKLDRTLTREILESPESAAIVAALSGAGRALGIVTAAEGVESEAQLELLRAAGVDQVQGYFLGHPQPIAKFDFGAARREPEAVSR